MSRPKNTDFLKDTKVAHLNVGLNTYIPPGTKVKKKVSRPKGRHLKKSGKVEFCDLCEEAGLPRPIPEYRPLVETHGRQHAVDFFFDTPRPLALEVEGWGHRTGKRFEEDRWKYNEITILGIAILRVRPKDLYKPETIDLIKRFFNID